MMLLRDLCGSPMAFECYDQQHDPNSEKFAVEVKKLKAGQPYFFGNLEVVATQFR